VYEEAKKRLNLRRSALNAVPDVVIRTDVTDVGIYAFDAKETIEVLRTNPALRSVRFDLVPQLVANQFRGGTAGPVAAFMVKPESYCVAVNSAKPALLEAPREIAAEFPHLNEKTLSKYDNIVDSSTTIGAKTTIGPGCSVAGGCVFSEKCSVKKSVIGQDCDFGIGVKISNSVILRGAVVHDGAQISNCLVGPGAVIGARAVAKDSIIGAGYEVDEEDDIRDETLRRKDN
jgi:translation initiation factor eIF-2B subunit gamma